MDQINVSSYSTPLTNHAVFSWPESPPFKQYFSLPDTIVFYATKNPFSPKCYSKLVQSCKYFFEKLPLLVVRHINDGGRKICLNHDVNKNYKCCINIDFTKVTCKIWLTNGLSLSRETDFSNITTKLLLKIYKCETVQLAFYNIRIKLEEFKLFAATFRKYFLTRVNIVNGDGSEVLLETILKSIPNVIEFSYEFNYRNPAATLSSLKNISALKYLVNLQYFCFANIPEIIPVQDIADFIKDHEDTKMRFHFAYGISEGYKYQINDLIDTVIDSEIRNCDIEYYGQYQSKLKIMESRFSL